MNIRELLHPHEMLDHRGNMNQEILEVTDDSRQVQPGSLFVAFKGEHVDGHNFILRAVEQGAVGIVLQKDFCLLDQEVFKTHSSVSWVRVNNSRRTLGRIAARFYHQPAKRLHMIGVTGTNGKTTVTYLSKAVLEAGGMKTGLLGTVGYILGPDHYPASHTTPGAVALQAMLAKMVVSGQTASILEVSSHALALDRVEGCEFDIAVFTNLTQDHLDFHETMEAYFQAKCRLFMDYLTRNGKSMSPRAIINIDDPWGCRLKDQCVAPVWTYGIHQPAEIHARDVELSLTGTRFTAVTPMATFAITSPLVGEHNVYNLLAAIGVGLARGVLPPVIQKSLCMAQPAPGRFERVDEGQKFSVIVDYAHTEDALTRLLTAAQKLKTGRILTVFGCGGDRDSGKRPKMGKVTAELSDRVYLTSDNPRSEDPVRILTDIERGILEVPESIRAPYQVIPDRREAIIMAINEAQAGDMVLIAGKGHEDYQLIGTKRIHFDDREEARKALRKLLI